LQNAAVGGSEKASDRAKLLGTWQSVTVKWRGRETKDTSFRLTFREKDVGYERETLALDGHYELDPAATPKCLDITFLLDTHRYIYRLEGDKLVLCKGNGTRERPHDFGSPDDNRSPFITTFQRIRRTEEKTTAAAAQHRRARLRCGGALHTLVRAMHGYIDEHGHFPPPAITDGAGKPLLSWRVAILPYLKEKELYDAFRHDEPWDSTYNRSLLPKMPKIYASVGNPPRVEHGTFYQVFVGAGALFEEGRRIRSQDVADGTVNTLAIVTAGEAVPWTKPADLPYHPGKGLPSLAVGMINDGMLSFATADSSVWVTRNTQEEELLRALITHSGGEFIDMRDLAK
jgi:uncharacterized protein (TIGR03067 family)